MKTLREKIEGIIESAEFQSFCVGKCPMRMFGCEEYCPVYCFKENLPEPPVKTEAKVENKRLLEVTA